MSIDTRRTAVLVIDELVTKGEDTLYNPSKEEQRVVDNSARIIEAARAAHMPVMFLCDQHIHDIDKELELWGDHGLKDVAVPNPLLKPGSSRWDFIIPKRRYSGFFQTDLDLTLRELGIKTVIAVGEDSNICVLHTLTDAFYLGYQSIVVEDATRTFLCGTQEGAIEHYKKCFGSRICSTAEVVAEVKGE
ncbi:MAG: cysteine hydrolase family protein [Atopobiaceae bacterium]